MVRSEDPPGATKHLRFGKISPEIQTALLGFPGVKSIVRHEGGAKGGSYKEHPHFHVWFESDTPITNQTVRNRLSKLPEFKDFSGQNDWSFRNHEDWEAWATYVVRNLKHTVILPYKNIDEIIEKVKNDPLHSPLKADTIQHIEGGQTVRVIQRKSRSMRVQFVDWLNEVHGFVHEETINPDNSHEMVSKLTDHLADFWLMAFTLNQAIQMINHAHWVYANPPERANIRSKFHFAVLKSNYLV